MEERFRLRREATNYTRRVATVHPCDAENNRGRGGTGRVLAERLRLSAGRHLLAAPEAFGTSTNSNFLVFANQFS
ncbi:hypothetical protein EVAR_94543_1 [Eumeta japonica]|uniref:Uncharacterized protein n=1 Tax=Eumeta variegata TaxID=151549 RepID=A0A4C1UWR9_EUMVA|nr:hypothetical protein EVAR_94543_1 [Eumeta japonica]